MDGLRRSDEAVTLLYVEDEEMTRERVLSMLAMKFPELAIYSAGDGEAGLELFGRVCPDLVITDINMPLMNGIEMSRRIMERSPVPIIVTSAHSDVEYLTESIEIGVSHFVMKPINGGRLFGCVERALNVLTIERERKRYAREIELLNQSLEARARELEAANEELESFSYTVSHDLRGPLTKIAGYCQLIQELHGARLEPQCREFLEIMERETVAMSGLINTLLDFSRLGRAIPERKPLDLSEIATAIAADIHLRQPQRRISFRIEPGVRAEGDPELLQVVLGNLLENACKYSGKNDEALVEFGVDAGGGESAYFVRDNGAGFEMAQAERLFKPFQRLHSGQEFGGIGIGLATVQRIVERHGGRVWARGEKGRGATFYFTLPGESGKGG